METTHSTAPSLAYAGNIDDRSRPRFVATGATNTGRIRPVNEDAARILPELGLFLVADGASEAGGGAEAAQLAVDTIAEDFASDGETTAPRLQDDEDPAAGTLRAAIQRADRRITARGKETGRPEMGTTIAALLVAGPRVVIAHVGDSRVYRLRAGAFERLTVDHTELAIWERLHRKPAPPEVRARHGHIITRALGGKQPGVIVDLRAEPWQPGDRFLLCSDGLHGLLSDEEMARTIESAPDLDCAVVRLVKRANEAGGHDNITAVLVRMLG
jgi:protein phosphatase